MRAPLAGCAVLAASMALQAAPAFGQRSHPTTTRPKNVPHTATAPTQARGAPAVAGQQNSAAQTVQGVVQSVTSTTVTIKQLDGTTVGVPVDRQTLVFVDGKASRLTAVKTGYVLDATWTKGQPAAQLDFFSTG